MTPLLFIVLISRLIVMFVRVIFNLQPLLLIFFNFLAQSNELSIPLSIILAFISKFIMFFVWSRYIFHILWRHMSNFYSGALTWKLKLDFSNRNQWLEESLVHINKPTQNFSKDPSSPIHISLHPIIKYDMDKLFHFCSKHLLSRMKMSFKLVLSCTREILGILPKTNIIWIVF